MEVVEDLQESLSTVFINDDWMYQQISQDQENFNVSQCIRDLTNHIWHICACSPIFNYKINKDSLEKLSKDLKCALLAEGITCTDLKVRSVPLLAYSENDEMAVQIAVTSQGKFYEALLISRGTKYKKNNHYVTLPVLLTRGSSKLTTTVNKFLEKLFHFSISPVKLTVKELLATSLIALKNGNFSDNVDIELKFRYYKNEDSTILYNVNQVNFKDLWESICDSDDTELSSTKIMNLFYNELIAHFRRIYGIDLGPLNLKIVKVESSFVIHSKGMVKSKVPEVYDFLLKHLTQRTNFEKHIPLQPLL